MIYVLAFAVKAIEDIKVLKKCEPDAFKKLRKLLEELEYHPATGTGKPEILKYHLSGLYSRKISAKHRLIYRIIEEDSSVVIMSALGHYYNK